MSEILEENIKQLSKYVQVIGERPKQQLNPDTGEVENVTDADGNDIMEPAYKVWGWFFPKEEFPDMVLDVVCDKDLVSPTIVSISTKIKNQSGVETSCLNSTVSANQIIVETGFKIDFERVWKWTHNNTYKDPERCDGSWGTTLPASGVNSSSLVKTDLTGGTSFTQNIYARKTGPTVSGSILVRPSGEVRKSVTLTIAFRSRLYCGITETAAPTGDQVKALVNKGLVTSKASTQNGVTASGTQYYCYAYPKSLGNLTSIVQNGAAPVLEDFIKTEVNVVNAAGATIPYLVYTSKNKGAFTNVSLAFK